MSEGLVYIWIANKVMGTSAKTFWEKNERIGLWKKWRKQGHRIDDADHYYFWDQSYILHCNRPLHPNTQCRIGLISEVIVIGIVNPMPLFLSLFSQSYPLIFSQKVLHLYNLFFWLSLKIVMVLFFFNWFLQESHSHFMYMFF